MIGIGHTELLVIGLVVLILFGHRLPSVMRSMGEAIRMFQRALYQEEPARENRPKRPSN